MRCVPSDGVQALAGRYRLARPERPQGGPAGELLGRGTGSSLEFQERREYVPGDDLRHLDWSAFARTDQLQVRLYREEIEPRVEILLDTSRSMAVEPAKAQLALDLATLFVLVAAEGGAVGRVVALDERPRPVELPELLAEGVEFTGRVPFPDTLDAASELLRPGAVRYLLSDLLFPAEPRALARRLAGRSTRLTVLQVLGARDARPGEGDALRLTDSESEQSVDLVLDPTAVRRYRERLRRLVDSWAAECARLAGGFHSLVSEGSLAEHCRERLAPAGVLEPR